MASAKLYFIFLTKSNVAEAAVLQTSPLHNIFFPGSSKHLLIAVCWNYPTRVCVHVLNKSVHPDLGGVGGVLRPGTSASLGSVHWYLPPAVETTPNAQLIFLPHRDPYVTTRLSSPSGTPS